MKNKFLFYLALALAFLLLQAPVYVWWCNTGVGTSLARVRSTAFNDVVATVFAVVGFFGAVALPNRLSEVGNKWCRIFSGSLCFALLVESIAHNASFVHFFWVPWLRYTDVLIVILIAFLVASFLKTKPTIQTTAKDADSPQLLYDDIDEADFLGRRERVRHICSFLQDNKGNSRGSTGVAITGGWGTGKSWVLQQVKRLLESSNEVCIEFKPWIYGDIDITRQFYLTLEHELRLQGIKVRELKDAVLEIDNEEHGGVGKALLSLMGIVVRTHGRAIVIEKIKDKLKNNRRDIYVFIDDCDRLAHDELLQVFSLIRNTGDFPYITYLMAFDEKMIERTIRNEGGIQYTAKMFNLMEALPPINDEVVAQYLNERATSILGKNGHPNPYTQVSITRFLPTIREAKKYLNQLALDYKKLEPRFDKYLLNPDDFCLLELLKYKYPDIYYGLHADPKNYLLYKNEAWNSPTGLPNEEKFIRQPEALLLMQAIFNEVTSPTDPCCILGAANREYLDLYFDFDPGNRYVEADVVNAALEDNSFHQKIGVWIDGGYIGVLGLICAVYPRLSPKDTFLSMAAYIRHQCKKNKSPIIDFGDAEEGYSRHNVWNSYRSIKQVVDHTPQVHLIAFQCLSDLVYENNDEYDELIQRSDLSLELMAIMLGLMRNSDSGDYPFDELKCPVGHLWEKIRSALGNATIDTLNIISLWADNTDENAFDTMILPLIAAYPQRWLGATLQRFSDDEREYYTFRPHRLHAIFGSLTLLNNELNKITSQVAPENSAYVNAYISLMHRWKMLMNKPELGNSDWDNVSVDKFPALADSIAVGSKSHSFYGTIFARQKESPFWRGENLRIHRWLVC